MQHSGTTTFLMGGEQREFRFAVEVTANEELSIWLEDKKTRAQWQAIGLTTTSFIAPETTIPGATLVDYAKGFAECLRAPHAAEDGSMGRLLSDPSKEGTRTLTVTLPFTWFSVAKTLTYEFTLIAMALDPVQVLTARVCELEEALAATKPNPPVQLDQIEGRELTDDEYLCWDVTQSYTHIEASKEAIRITQDGIYAVQFIADYADDDGNDSFVSTLEINGKAVCECEGYLDTASGLWFLKTNDRIRVKFDDDVDIVGKLTIVKLA
ncbi:hypothetical protein Poli38472_010920 [Pythium oligandrum]|uniref:Uncharacterized protein n=1 Tax=Pythium oligandrum TaxID=41045 RepID=A0A8K1CGR8_PYTOL|nr:hypothetical protein Poli38472_010920 [Pythium oligandrum]|eukprot:TMW61857.1 hypothetical protein Poli38472_010920 [Pythium oligandrum]